jgi:hypothetical protein
MCDTVRFNDGSAAIVCFGHGRGRRKKCAYPTCTARATVECDHQEAAGKTCDRATCRAHAKPIDRNVDWCWKCAQLEARRGHQPRLAL